MVRIARHWDAGASLSIEEGVVRDGLAPFHEDSEPEVWVQVVVASSKLVVC